MRTLILGGARSGKSRYAEQLAQTHAEVYYIATAQAHDAEMAARIAAHQRQRPALWQTHEVPIRLAHCIENVDAPGRLLLVDCLTLWLSNCLHAGDTIWQQQRQDLLVALSRMQADCLLVSNEVGQGIVPVGELSRRFVDEAGRLHQELAGVCERVVWMVAGLPQRVKGG